MSSVTGPKRARGEDGQGSSKRARLDLDEASSALSDSSDPREAGGRREADDDVGDASGNSDAASVSSSVAYDAALVDGDGKHKKHDKASNKKGGGPRNEKGSERSKKRKEAAGAWLADGWTNNGVYAPEMAQLRDMAFIVKMMVCDPYSLRESLKVRERGVTRSSWLKQAIIYPSAVLPTWEVT